MGISSIQGVMAQAPTRTRAVAGGGPTWVGAQLGSPAPLTDTPSGRGLLQLTQIDAAVTDILRALDSSAEESAKLRAAITLLVILTILAALLDRGAQSRLPTALSSGGGPGSQSVGIYASYTSVAFEHTTVSLTFSAAESSIPQDYAQMPESHGGRIDLTG